MATKNIFNNPKPYSSGGTPMKSYPKSQSLGNKIGSTVKGVGRSLNNRLTDGLNNSVSSSSNDKMAKDFKRQQLSGRPLGFKKGGKVQQTGKALVHKGEVVVPKKVVKKKTYAQVANSVRKTMGK